MTVAPLKRCSLGTAGFGDSRVRIQMRPETDRAEPRYPSGSPLRAEPAVRPTDETGNRPLESSAPVPSIAPHLTAAAGAAARAAGAAGPGRRLAEGPPVGPTRRSPGVVRPVIDAPSCRQVAPGGGPGISRAPAAGRPALETGPPPGPPRRPMERRRAAVRPLGQGPVGRHGLRGAATRGPSAPFGAGSDSGRCPWVGNSREPAPPAPEGERRQDRAVTRTPIRSTPRNEVLCARPEPAFMKLAVSAGPRAARPASDHPALPITSLRAIGCGAGRSAAAAIGSESLR